MTPFRSGLSRRRLLKLLPPFALAPLSACSAPTDVIDVSLAMNPWIAYGLWYIAKARGFDRAHGVSLGFVTLNSVEAFQSALAAGTVDSGHVALTAAITLQDAGVAFKAVLFQDISTTGDALIAGAAIRRVEDLRGRRVALPIGTGSELLLRLALEQAGLSPQDVTLVDLPQDQAAIAYIAGHADAAVTYEPYIANAIKARSGTIRLVTAGAYPGVISDFLVVKPAFAAAHPQAVVGMLLAWEDSIRYLRAHPAEGMRIIAANSGGALSAEDLAPAFKGVDIFDLGQSLAFIDSRLPALADKVQGLMRASRRVRGDQPFSAILDASFLRSALARRPAGG